MTEGGTETGDFRVMGEQLLGNGSQSIATMEGADELGDLWIVGE